MKCINRKNDISNLEYSKKFKDDIDNIKNQNWVPFDRWNDTITNLVRSCFECFQGCNTNMVPDGILRNLLDVDHLHIVHNDEFSSWRTIRFISRLKTVEYGPTKKNNRNNFGWFQTSVYHFWIIIGYISSICLGFVHRLLMSIVYFLLPLCMWKLIVHSGQLKCIKSTLRFGTPVIFLPVYRSSFDYLFFTIAFFLTKVPQPIIFKHKNENIALSWILRIMGVRIYVINRESSTKLPNLAQCLRDGSPIMFHLEEYPVRRSKLTSINGDIMYFLMEAYNTKMIENIFIVPVNINYDTLPVYTFHIDVLRKPSYSLSLTKNIWFVYKCLTTQHGMCRITLCQPFSLFEIIKLLSKNVSNNAIEYASYPIYASIMTRQKKLLVDKLMNHIIYDRCNTEVTMSTNIISFIFLHRNVEYFTLTELVAEFGAICDAIENTHQTGFDGFELDVVVYALRLLSPHLMMRLDPDYEDDEYNRQQIRQSTEWLNINVDLLIESDRFVVKPKDSIDSSEELFYYSDILNNSFVLDGIVGRTIVKLYDEKYASSERVVEIFHHEIVKMSSKFCCLLQYEFPFFKPCGNLAGKINNIIMELCKRDILIQYQPGNEEGLLEEECWARRFASNFDDDSGDEDYDGYYDDDDFDDNDDDYYNYNDYHQIGQREPTPVNSSVDTKFPSLFAEFEDNNIDQLSSTNYTKYTFNRSDENVLQTLLRHSSIIEPYLQVYAANGADLLKTLKAAAITEDEFIENSLPLYENIKRVTCLSDMLRNSLKLFHRLNVLSYSEETGRKYLRLNETYLDENYFRKFVNELHSFL